MGKLYHKLLQKLHLEGRDVTVILSSLLLAFGIWFIHTLSRDYVTVTSFSVKAVSNLEDCSRESAEPVVVVAKCSMSGFKAVGSRFSDEDEELVLAIDADDFTKEPDGRYSIKSDALRRYVEGAMPGGVNLESILTPVARFLFLPEVHKKVPVIPFADISYQDQYIPVGDITVSPDSVMLYGSPEIIAGIDRINTSKIKLEDVHSNTHGEVALETINGVEYSDDNVVYSLEVSRFVEFNLSVPVEVKGAPFNKTFAVYPSHVNVTLCSMFPAVVEPSIDVYINYKDYQQSDNGACIVHYSEPSSGVISYSVSPESVICLEVESR